MRGRPDGPVAFTTVTDIKVRVSIPVIIAPGYSSAREVGSSAILAGWKGTIFGKVSWTSTSEVYQASGLVVS